MNLVPFDDRPRVAPPNSRQARAGLLRICRLSVAVALLAGVLVAATLVAEAAETSEAPLATETVEVLPQQIPAPAASAGSSGDRWPWAIVAGVLVTLAGGSYAAARGGGSV